MCSRSFLLPNINGSSQPWALSLWGMYMLLIFSKQSFTSSLQIPAYRAGENRGFCPSQQPSRRLCASCQMQVCYRLLLNTNLILCFLSLGDCFWLLATWVMQAWCHAPMALGAEWRDPEQSDSFTRALSSQAGKFMTAQCRGMFLTRLRQELGGTVNRAWLSHL